MKVQILILLSLTTKSDNTNTEINLDSDTADSDIMGIQSDTESFTIASDMASTFDMIRNSFFRK